MNSLDSARHSVVSSASASASASASVSAVNWASTPQVSTRVYQQHALLIEKALQLEPATSQSQSQLFSSLIKERAPSIENTLRLQDTSVHTLSVERFTPDVKAMPPVVPSVHISAPIVVAFPASPEPKQGEKASSEISPELLAARIDLAKQFKVGDVVFTKATPGIFEWPDRFIQYGQWVSQLCTGSLAPKDNQKIVHSAIVVEVNESTGQVLIAEAMPGSGLRIIDMLTHESCQIRPGNSCTYEVLRPSQDLENMTREAARIATTMGNKASYLLNSEDGSNTKGIKKKQKQKKLKSHYSWSLGFISLFKSSKVFNADAKRRAYHMIFDHANQRRLATCKSGPRSFVCSSFIAYVLQRAAIAQNLKEVFKLESNGLLSVSSNASNQDIAKWAREQANNPNQEDVFEKVLPKTSSFRIDAKHMKPYELKDLLKDQFTPVLEIVAAEKLSIHNFKVSSV